MMVFLPLLVLAQTNTSSGNFSDLPAQNLTITLLPDEKIWSGVVDEGHIMPYPNQHQFDMYGNNLWNQVQPVIISNKGLWVWSEDPYQFQIDGDKLVISNALGKIETGRNGVTLAEAPSFVANKFFPASGKLPDELLFAAPQYNTWIELTYNQNQEDILIYAKAILENGLQPGVLMIDDTWQEDYGKWTFHPGKFPDPKGMIKELHAMGFKVMVWVCPFVSADQYMIVQEVMKNKGFLLQKPTKAPPGKQPLLPPLSVGGTASLPYSILPIQLQLIGLTPSWIIWSMNLESTDLNSMPVTFHSIRRPH